MLRPFTQSDFPLLSSWVNSEELLHQFSATTFPYPLNYTDMEWYMAANPDRQFYMISNELYGDFGFGEIIPQYANVPRLGRLLIGNPDLRGKGLGKQLLQQLIAECKRKFASTAVELYVLIDNYPAIKCYQAAGFQFLDNNLEINLNGIKKVMRKMRVNF
jgi:RimJ/RimL family protein N-acetyltransferase